MVRVSLTALLLTSVGLPAARAQTPPPTWHLDSLSGEFRLTRIE